MCRNISSRRRLPCFALLSSTACLAREPVTVALVSRTLFNMPDWGAERKGYLKEDGYEFKLKLTPSAEDLNAGLRSGALQPFPLSYQAEAAGFTNLGPMLAIVADWQFTTVNANAAWARQNPKCVASFLRALRKGQAYMEANPDEAAQIAAEELRTELPMARRALADAAKFRILDVELSQAGLVRMFEALKGAGQIPRERKFELHDFVDTSYLAASKK